jgi:hypothetical protein
VFFHDAESTFVAVGAEAGGVFYAGGPEATSDLSSASLAPGRIVAQGWFVHGEPCFFELAVIVGQGIGDKDAFPEGDFHLFASKKFRARFRAFSTYSFVS